MLDVTTGTVLADRYTIGHRLGVGGTGVVWQARDEVLRRDVALKVVRNGEHARLEREARAAAGVNDRRVVAVYDAGKDGDTVFLVMEMVQGIDLGQVLQVCGGLPPNVTALLGRDLATGLGAVHAARIIHRDIKPSNVLLTREGDVKLGDLGIARTSDSTSTVALTETGTIVGTIDYLAPEQLAEHEITPATDIYAVGLLLLECATGEKPFGEGTLAERAARRLTRSPEPPANVHPPLRAAITAAVERDPDDRPQQGYELAQMLDEAVNEEESVRAELASLVSIALAAPPDERRTRSAGSLDGSESYGKAKVDLETVAYSPTGAHDARDANGAGEGAAAEAFAAAAAEAPAGAARGVDTPAGTPLVADTSVDDAGAPAQRVSPLMQRAMLEAAGLIVAVVVTVVLATAITG